MKYCFKTYSKGLALAVLFSMTVIVSFAQLTTVSPYSRFGLGDIYYQGSSTSYGMGGVSAAFQDNSTVNFLNPATYSNVSRTTFQAGVRIQNVNLESPSQTSSVLLGNLGYVNLLFKRAQSKWSFAAGMVPFSSSGYSVTQSFEDDILGEYSFQYDGVGGINQAYLGLSRRWDFTQRLYFNDSKGNVTDSLKFIKHQIAVGVNGNYYFGELTQTRRVEIIDPTYLNSRITSSTQLRKTAPEFGIHYTTVLKSDYTIDKKLRSLYSLMFGATYSPSFEMNADFDEVHENTQYFSGVEVPVDTAEFYSGAGSSTIPQKTSVGIALTHRSPLGRKFLLGVDLKNMNWSTYKRTIDGEELESTLSDSQTLAVGFQYTPKKIDDGENIWERGTYRVGVRTTESYLTVNDQQLTEQALSVGFSFPMVSSISQSKFNFGMEIGDRGSVENGQVKETFMTFNFGVSLTPFLKNRWFIERKYD